MAFLNLMTSSYGSRGASGILLSIVTMSMANMGSNSQGERERVRRADKNMMTRELALGWKTIQVDYLSALPMVDTKI